MAKTRPDSEKAVDIIKEYIEWGAGPRASQYMIMADRETEFEFLKTTLVTVGKASSQA